MSSLRVLAFMLLTLCTDSMVGQTGPVLVSDQSDYMAGTTVTLNGSGFTPGETVVILIVHVDGSTPHPESHLPFNVVADSNGNITAQWLVPSDGAEDGAALIATATGQTSGLQAIAYFTDNVKVDFRQSANDDGGYGLGNIHWINSIVQQSNSVYYEGMSNMQRVILDDVAPTTGNVHSIKFGHQSTKGGHHAYDFLTGRSGAGTNPVTETGWDQAISDDEAALFVTYSINKCGNEIGPPASLATTCSNLHSALGFFIDVEFAATAGVVPLAGMPATLAISLFLSSVVPWA